MVPCIPTEQVPNKSSCLKEAYADVDRTLELLRCTQEPIQAQQCMVCVCVMVKVKICGIVWEGHTCILSCGLADVMLPVAGFACGMEEAEDGIGVCT